MCHLIVYKFSRTADELNQLVGTAADLEVALKAKVDSIVNTNIGWSLAWGPAVFKKVDNAETGPDVAWFVATHPWTDENGITSEVYVVSMAGNVASDDTDIISHVVDLSDWVQNGIEKFPKPQLNDGSSTDRILVASGFAQYIFQIVNLIPKDRFPGARFTLPDFLATRQPPAGSYLTFTGHSVGGALCPILAETLLLNGSTKAFSKDKIAVYPTAGPSPGNNKFALQFTADFPPKFPPKSDGFEAWNCNIVNSLDIVPRAYSAGLCVPYFGLQSVLSMYGSAPQDVEPVIEALKGIAKETYCSITTSIFSTNSPIQITNQITVHDFITAALEFHYNGYPGSAPEGSEVNVAIADVSAAEQLQAAHSNPIIGLLLGI
jgi:hypothetical protein